MSSVHSPIRIQQRTRGVFIAAALVAALAGCVFDGDPVDDREPAEVSTVTSALSSSVLAGPILIRPWNFINYITAEDGGNCDVVANRTVAGEWEEFYVKPLGANWIALQDATSGYYVSAEGGGGGLVHANRVAIGPWEQFWIPNPDSSVWQFNTWKINYWLCAEGGGGGIVNATRTSPAQWETFFIQALPDLAGYKYRRGKCACSNGEVKTSPINPPSKDHGVCTAAVKAACQICVDEGLGNSNRAMGCDHRI